MKNFQKFSLKKFHNLLEISSNFLLNFPTIFQNLHEIFFEKCFSITSQNIFYKKCYKHFFSINFFPLYQKFPQNVFKMYLTFLPRKPANTCFFNTYSAKAIRAISIWYMGSYELGPRGVNRIISERVNFNQFEKNYNKLGKKS